MNQTAIPCILMRGGTSKGPFSFAHDLPADPALRDAVAAMGSPDARQISTRNFVPHTVHKAIGVLGAVNVATACALPGSIAAEVTGDADYGSRTFEIEHPTGFFTVAMDVVAGPEGPRVERSALLRTARALVSGEVLVPGNVWDGRSDRAELREPALSR